MKKTKPCGVCDNCKKLEKVKQSVLRCCNPPFSHADQDVVDVWNDSLERYPCERPLEILPLNEVQQDMARNDVKGRKEICGHKRGEKYIIHNETYLFFDAQAEGSSWEGILVKGDYTCMMYNVPQKLMEETRRYM